MIKFGKILGCFIDIAIRYWILGLKLLFLIDFDVLMISSVPAKILFAASPQSAPVLV